MNLWTEYEGKTVDDAYTLGKLLRSEGRNGFFRTSDTTGHAAVIRLTEAHFDEAEQLQRWRQVADVHQNNLIEIERVGQTTFDGVALTYALMCSQSGRSPPRKPSKSPRAFSPRFLLCTEAVWCTSMSSPPTSSPSVTW